MKIELKKVKINLTFSEETTMFNADVMINGVKTAYAKNDGRGGNTFYSHYDGKIELLRKAEEFCKSKPKEKVDFGGKIIEFDVTLESVIDKLIGEELKKKEQKKLEKRMVNSILWGKPNGETYMEVKFKVPLDKIPLKQLQEFVNKYKTQLKNGEIFLNTNFQKLGVIA